VVSPLAFLLQNSFQVHSLGYDVVPLPKISPSNKNIYAGDPWHIFLRRALSFLVTPLLFFRNKPANARNIGLCPGNCNTGRKVTQLRSRSTHQSGDFGNGRGQDPRGANYMLCVYKVTPLLHITHISLDCKRRKISPTWR
jgi:hypothetical protein